MRGAIAAACAAVFMGLAPTPVLASLSSACRDRIESVARAQRSMSLGIGARQAAEPKASRTATHAPARELVRVTFMTTDRTIWRAPSAPAPSRAPPAAA
jgi:hypothetical protein